MSFKEIIGQENAKKTLLGNLSSGKIPHALLFIGQEGIGRKLTAFEFSKSLNCTTNSHENSFTDPCGHCLSCEKISKNLHPDVKLLNYEWQANLLGEDIEKQKNIKIDSIRALQREVSLKPTEGKWKVFIIDPAEEITVEAANSLLKTLEEPPKKTVLILLAKHKEALPATVVSRTQIILFKPLNEKIIKNHLMQKLDMDESLAARSADRCEGSLSKAIFFSSENDPVAADFWPSLKECKFSKRDLLKKSDSFSQNPTEFLEELISDAKIDFRLNPSFFNAPVDLILNSQDLIGRNINAKMVLDSLLLNLNDHFNRKQLERN